MADQLSRLWDGVNNQEVAVVEKLSDAEVHRMVDNFKESKTTAARDKVREILRPLGVLGRSNLLHQLSKEMVTVQPGDPYAMTDAAKFLYSVDGKHNEALILLRRAWLEMRHLSALEIYAGAALQMAAAGRTEVSPPEIRTLADDLIRFQNFDIDFTSMLLGAGYLLKPDNADNRKLQERILVEVDLERVRKQPELERTLAAIRSRLTSE